MPNTKNNSWKITTLVIIFGIIGIGNLVVVLLGNPIFSSNEFGPIVRVISGIFSIFILFTAWSFYMKMDYTINWGFVIVIILLIGNILIINYIGIILLMLLLYLVLSTRPDITSSKKNPNLKYWMLGMGILLLLLTFLFSSSTQGILSVNFGKYEDAIYADKLVAEFQNNPIKAEKDYVGKQIIVHGPIVSISEELGFPMVSLGSLIYQSVICGLSDKTQAYPLNTGDIINIQGTLTGTLSMNVAIADCMILP